jgi:hypothetical protein
MSQDATQVVVRSYAVVLDRLERRIFRIDRWRIPLPMGIELRALGYAAAIYLVLLAARRLPLAGALLGLLPAPVHWLVLPLVVVVALLRWQIDGRRPHRVLVSLVRWRLGPRTLSGLRRSAPRGARLTPVTELCLAPGPGGARYRRGRIAGPATVALGLPATARLSGRRLVVTARPAAHPLSRPKTVRIPARGALVLHEEGR